MEWIKKNWKYLAVGACLIAVFTFNGISGCTSRRRTEKYLLESLEHIRAAADSQREVLELLGDMGRQFSDITTAVGEVGTDIGTVIDENRRNIQGYDELRRTINRIGDEIRADAELYSELGELGERGIRLLETRQEEEH